MRAKRRMIIVIGVERVNRERVPNFICSGECGDKREVRDIYLNSRSLNEERLYLDDG